MILQILFIISTFLRLFPCIEEKNWDLIYLLKKERHVTFTNEFTILLKPSTNYSEMFLSAKTLFPDNIFPEVFIIMVRLKFLNEIQTPGTIFSITDPDHEKRLSLTLKMIPGIIDRVTLIIIFHPVNEDKIIREVVLPFTKMTIWTFALSFVEDKVIVYTACEDIKRPFGYQYIEMKARKRRTFFKDGAILNFFNEGNGWKKLKGEIFELAFANHLTKLQFLCGKQSIEGSGSSTMESYYQKLGNVLLTSEKDVEKSIDDEDSDLTTTTPASNTSQKRKSKIRKYPKKASKASKITSSQTPLTRLLSKAVQYSRSKVSLGIKKEGISMVPSLSTLNPTRLCTVKNTVNSAKSELGRIKCFTRSVTSSTNVPLGIICNTKPQDTLSSPEITAKTSTHIQTMLQKRNIETATPQNILRKETKTPQLNVNSRNQKYYTNQHFNRGQTSRSRLGITNKYASFRSKSQGYLTFYDIITNVRSTPSKYYAERFSSTYNTMTYTPPPTSAEPLFKNIFRDDVFSSKSGNKYSRTSNKRSTIAKKEGVNDKYGPPLSVDGEFEPSNPAELVTEKSSSTYNTMTYTPPSTSTEPLFKDIFRDGVFSSKSGNKYSRTSLKRSTIAKEEGVMGAVATLKLSSVTKMKDKYGLPLSTESEFKLSNPAKPVTERSSSTENTMAYTPPPTSKERWFKNPFRHDVFSSKSANEYSRTSSERSMVSREERVKANVVTSVSSVTNMMDKYGLTLSTDSQFKLSNTAEPVTGGTKEYTDNGITVEDSELDLMGNVDKVPSITSNPKKSTTNMKALHSSLKPAVGIVTNMKIVILETSSKGTDRTLIGNNRSTETVKTLNNIRSAETSAKTTGEYLSSGTNMNTKTVSTKERNTIKTFSPNRIHSISEKSLTKEPIKLTVKSTSTLNLESKERQYDINRTHISSLSSEELAKCQKYVEKLLSLENCPNRLLPSLPVTTSMSNGEKGRKGDRGDRGYQGAIGPPGVCTNSQCLSNNYTLKGDKGETGKCEMSQCLSVPGDRGEKGMKGSIGDKGERGQTSNINFELIKDKLLLSVSKVVGKGTKGDKGESGQCQCDKQFEKVNNQARFQENINIGYGSLVFDNRESLEEVSGHLPLGSMAFILKTDMFLVKISYLNNIWRSINLDSKSKDWVFPNSQSTHTVDSLRPFGTNGANKMLYLVALPTPTTGDLKSTSYQPGGYNGAVLQCQQSGGIYGYGGLMHPLLSSDTVNIRFILNDAYKYLPIYNSRGEILASNFQSLLSRSSMLENEILDFERRPINDDAISPCVWIGNDSLSEFKRYQQNPDVNCNNWMSRTSLFKGSASVLTTKSLLSDFSITSRDCSLQCHILCIQTEPRGTF